MKDSKSEEAKEDKQPNPKLLKKLAAKLKQKC